MEDTRKYHSDEDEARRISDDDRKEYSAASSEDEVPFHIPRD
jgi:hypothetical protein